MKGFPVTLWLAPNVNSVGATSRGARAKIEGVEAQLKAGSGARSLVFGKPKLIEDGPAACEKGDRRGPPAEANRFFSYSCSCWKAPTIKKIWMHVRKMVFNYHS